MKKLKQLIMLTPSSKDQLEQEYIEKFCLTRFGTIAIQLRSETPETLKQKLDRYCKLLKDDNSIILSLSPWKHGAFKWDQRLLPDQTGKAMESYFNFLMPRYEIIKYYLDQIKYIICEGEWGNKDLCPPDRITTVNNLTFGMLKALFPQQKLVIYGRGMCGWTPRDIPKISPWWTGPVNEKIDVFTTHLYDPHYYKTIEKANLEYTINLAKGFKKKIIPFVSILYKNYNGWGPVNYSLTIERNRGKMLIENAENIEAFVIYPTPIISNKQTTDWFMHYANLTGEMRYLGLLENTA